MRLTASQLLALWPKRHDKWTSADEAWERLRRIIALDRIRTGCPRARL
jgi:septum formation topological specificity factor MinE